MPGSEMLAQSSPAEEKGPDYVRLDGTSSLSLKGRAPETAVVMTVPCAKVGHCLGSPQGSLVSKAIHCTLYRGEGVVVSEREV